MSSPSSSDDAEGLKIVESLDQMIKVSKQHPTKVIAVLFNVKSPPRFSLERKLESWWDSCRKNKEVRFYKHICYTGKEFEKDFNIKQTPAFAFFHNGKQIETLQDLEEAQPDFYPATRSSEETKDEKSLKEVIERLCKSI